MGREVIETYYIGVNECLDLKRFSVGGFELSGFISGVDEDFLKHSSGGVWVLLIGILSESHWLISLEEGYNHYRPYGDNGFFGSPTDQRNEGRPTGDLAVPGDVMAELLEFGAELELEDAKGRPNWMTNDLDIDCIITCIVI